MTDRKPRVPRPGCDLGCRRNGQQHAVSGRRRLQQRSAVKRGNAIPFPDALQEFSVESGVRDARFGMSTGATVNAVTKSGTNASTATCSTSCAITRSMRSATSRTRRTAASAATTG